MSAIQVMSNLYSKMMRESAELYSAKIAEFRAIYENDWEIILDLLEKYFVNKPYAKETMDKMFFMHRDEVQKILRRKCAGIYDKAPDRILWENGSETAQPDEALPYVLEEADYNRVCYEALHQSKFFNTVIAHPVWRDGKVQIDLHTAESVQVETGAEFLKIQSIKIVRLSEVNGNKEIIKEYWSDTEHYLLDANDKKIPVEGNEMMVNPYIQAGANLGTDPLPFVILRDRTQYDFWGEPNWDLFLYQLQADMDLTDTKFGEKFLKFPMLFYTGDLPDGLVVSPNKAVDLGIKAGVPGTATYLNPPTDWVNIRENETHQRASIYSAQGLPESSASIDGSAPRQVGSKIIDEVELKESRDNDKMKLVGFERELLRKIQMVNNTYETRKEYKLTDKQDSYLEVRFSEATPSETIQDKIARREYELRYGIRSIADIVAEELQVSRDEAMTILEENKQLNTQYAPQQQGQSVSRTRQRLEELRGNA